MLNYLYRFLAVTTFILIVTFTTAGQDLKNINLPDGFTIEIYADNLSTVRAMAFDEEGTLYAGSKRGNVYAIDQSRQVKTIAAGLEMPVGVDYYKGNLYISAISRIYLLRDVKSYKKRELKLELINDSLPTDRHHGWKFIKVGPDGLLYVPVGAPCNVCEPEDERYSSIMRMGLDGKGLELFASGVRNTVGFDWHPVSKVLWFTDNGRDMMGDNIPPDELNRAAVKGLHFGFPYFHGTNIADPEYGRKRPNLKYERPIYNLPAHVAALGMRFYNSNHFPAYYKGGIFIAEHGSWNRRKKIGYRVTFIKLEGDRALSYETFAAGWLQGESYWGRPADVEIGPEGALYISDDYTGIIYRVTYNK